jgi:hypothetical protein
MQSLLSVWTEFYTHTQKPWYEYVTIILRILSISKQNEYVGNIYLSVPYVSYPKLLATLK